MPGTAAPPPRDDGTVRVVVVKKAQRMVRRPITKPIVLANQIAATKLFAGLFLWRFCQGFYGGFVKVIFIQTKFILI